MVSDVSAEPRSGWTDLAGGQGYQSILVVPLIASTGVIGTLNSYRVTSGEFSAQEVEQLELLAEHATIALTSARILDDLREQHRLIVRSEEIHDRLLSVALRSGGVSGIACALNDLLNCDVVIQDVHGATLAAKPMQSAARLSSQLQDLSARSPAVPSLIRDIGAHIAADVEIEGGSVATVWLLNRAGDLDTLGIRAIEHATVVLSLELLRQRTAAEVEQRLRGELLADLLAGADPNSTIIRDRARLMEHNLSQPHRMLVAAARRTAVADSHGQPEADDFDLAQRAATEAVRLASHLRPRPLIAAIRGSVVALWPEINEVAAGERVLRRAFSLTRDGVTAAVAETEVEGNGIPAAYRGAKGALSLAAREGGHRTTVSLDDLGVAGLLLQFADPDEIRRYAERTIGVVRRYDVDHGAELFKTLRAYLDCDLDRRATGEFLILHPNTVSQRLRRIEALTGLNLHSPRSVMEARTALMLTDVADSVVSTRDDQT